MNNLVNEISALVEETCKMDTCRPGYQLWSHHIVHVVKYANMLAKKLNADPEVVEISALLHDYASVKGEGPQDEHHIYGAKLSEEILKGYNYPQDKIDNIKHCVYAHRASRDIPRETIEADIIACADAMAHFDKINSLLRLAFATHGLNTDDGSKWVLGKLKRSWNKLMPEAKEMVSDKYEAAKILLSNK